MSVAKNGVTLGECHVHVVLSDRGGGDLMERLSVREVAKIINMPSNRLLTCLRI